MQDTIISQMLDSLRDCGLPQQQSFQLCLLILAWAKMSAKKAIPEELRITSTLLDDPVKTRKAFELFGASEDVGEELRIPEGIRPTFELAMRLSDTGVLQQLDVADAICALDSRYLVDAALPPEVATLLVDLAGIRSGDSVYTPWDNGGQLAARAVRTASKVFLETPLSWPIAFFVSLLSDKPFDVTFTDPITKPSAVEGGKPRKFDVAVSFPTLGLKYDPDVVRQDWFDRFPERTTSGSVLAIRHLLSQANRRVVVAVPNSLLFSVGAELSLREDLVEKGLIEAVIAMPAGLLSYSKSPFAILVLDPVGKHNEIRFVNADVPRFREASSKPKFRLTELAELIQLTFDPSYSEYARTAFAEEVMGRGAQLQVNRYVLQESSKRYLWYFENTAWGLLGDMVDTVRPMPTTPNRKGAIEVREIGAVDLPPYGYILEPGRTVYVDREIAAKNKEQFLQPLDIVLIVKGSVGKLGIVPPQVQSSGQGGWVAGQSAIVLRRNSEVGIDSRALAIQLRSPLGQELLSTIVSGAAIPLIQLRELMHLEILDMDEDATRQAIDALEEETRLQREIDRLKQAQSEVTSGLWGPFDV